MLQIKKVVDYLAAVGSPISVENHIKVILDGLNEDHASLITIVLSRVQPFSINDLEALLMAQEERIERFRKSETSLVQANASQTSLQDSRSSGRGFGGRRGTGGRNSWNNSSIPQCQLCGKYGHLAWQCFHRFDQAFQNPSKRPTNNLMIS